MPLGSTAAVFSAYGLAASDIVLTEEIVRKFLRGELKGGK